MSFTIPKELLTELPDVHPLLSWPRRAACEAYAGFGSFNFLRRRAILVESAPFFWFDFSHNHEHSKAHAIIPVLCNKPLTSLVKIQLFKAESVFYPYRKSISWSLNQHTSHIILLLIKGKFQYYSKRYTIISTHPRIFSLSVFTFC